MRKNRIAIKLSVNFAIALLTFSIIIGSMFFYLFRNYTIEIHKNELLKYATSLSNILSTEENRNLSRGMGGYGAYFRFIVDVADTDVWILDKNMELTTAGKGPGMMSGKYNLSALPPNAEELILQVLQGKTAFSEGFSETLAQPTLTVGTPIKNESGEIIGAVLLHSPIEGTKSAVNKGFSILITSMLLALAITSVLSLFFSYSFTKPLNKMKEVALQLSAGDYAAKCNINQNDEIGELANTIDSLAVRLDEASKESSKLEKLRREFVANISHELRTPITVIRGSLEALHDKVVTDSDKVEEYQIQMINEAKFLERLVSDLLDLSKLQNAEFAIDKSTISINDVISDVTRSATQLANKKNIEIKTKFEDDTINIQGDYGRLRQMFLILIDNAIKFSPNNSTIEILATKEEISIRDNGPGIDDADLPYIFDRFFKTHGEDNKSGTGLGLAIAKQIAERHNIVLTAENNPDGGAKFICKLPSD